MDKGSMIDAHIIDLRGVYLSTVSVDPMGPQPSGAVYADLPAAAADHTRLWVADEWRQVPDAEVPPAPEPPGSEPAPLPHSCTRRQGLLALLAYGHRRADIEALIAAIPDEVEREAALIEYEAATWERASPFLQQMWAQLGGTPEQLDDLFRMAVTL